MTESECYDIWQSMFGINSSAITGQNPWTKYTYSNVLDELIETGKLAIHSFIHSFMHSFNESISLSASH